MVGESGWADRRNSFGKKDLQPDRTNDINFGTMEGIRRALRRAKLVKAARNIRGGRRGWRDRQDGGRVEPQKAANNYVV